MPVSFSTIIDVLGTFSFATAGAFAAMEKKLDPFGVLIISFVTAIGGGTIRDILIGDLPVAWLTNITTLWVIPAGAAIALFFGAHLKKLSTVLFIFDALGVGFFTMIGIEKGIQHELGTGVCIALGTITGCFGGVLRDVLLNNVPLIFHKEIYALACIAGGSLYFILLKLHVDDRTSNLLAIACTFVVRVLAVKYNWALPLFYEGREKKNP